MPIEIIVPRLGWSMEEGAFVAWLKKDGEQVRAGEPLFSIEGDKAVQEIESLDSGILRIAPDAPKPAKLFAWGTFSGTYCCRARQSKPLWIHPALAGHVDAEGKHSTGRSHERLANSCQAERCSDKPNGGADAGDQPAALRVAAELKVDWTRVIGTGRAGRIRERDIRAAAGLAIKQKESIAKLV
jgi:pyruvate dehydrogenase E2 component (dihydrolipoamide acetyltransferase)